MNRAPLITDVRITAPLQLLITWNTGESLACNLEETVNRHLVFTPLADAAVFSRVAVDEWGHGLDWPAGLDMGADRLYQLCREQAGLLSPAGFDEWMKRNQLSLSAAAEALGMSRRMVAHYRAGTRPIPKTVQLACIGWEALRNAA